jgi:hypothetical protein
MSKNTVIAGTCYSCGENVLEGEDFTMINIRSAVRYGHTNYSDCQKAIRKASRFEQLPNNFKVFPLSQL